VQVISARGQRFYIVAWGELTTPSTITTPSQKLLATKGFALLPPSSNHVTALSRYVTHAAS
jgi:hypothetical protein